MSLAPSPITVFWRPGCVYCARLRSRLRRAGVRTEEVNIWTDAEGAAYVRSVTGGDETVPTVRVGDRALVNPTPARLLREIEERHPNLVVAEQQKSDVLRLAQWVVVGILIVGSFLAEALGHASLSWGIDGVALIAFLILRAARSRVERAAATTGAGSGGNAGLNSAIGSTEMDGS